ncbi:MAG: hypothetical protein D6702_04640 [Planctomycetota bacterium]|nr:MAG: hypothetical protein D6702_04640 [Planctomycetota bacterium]
MQNRRILGVDPGTRIAGWGVVVEEAPGRLRRLASGVWRLDRRQPAAVRLARLQELAAAALREWRPDRLALEAAFFGRNARSALRLGEARGVILAAAAAAGVEVVELPPALVKRRVGGGGAVSKEGLAALVAAQLGFEPRSGPADETDALAVALCAFLQAPAETRKPGHNGRELPPGAALQ